MLVKQPSRARRSWLLLVAVLAACDTSDPSAPSVDLSVPAVFARATADSVFVGRNMRVVAVATGDSAAVAWPRFAWSSTDTMIARVDSTGAVLGITPGRVWVRAALGALVDSALVTVGVASVRHTGAVQSVAIGTRQCAIQQGGVAACLDTLPEDSIPTLVPLDGASTVALEQLSASTTHTCGLQTSGALYCWGTNGQGERMNGTTGASSTTPVPSGGTGRYSSVSVGTNYTCATERVTLRTLCAGANGTRQLGRVTTGARDSVPQPIDQTALTSALGSRLSNSNGSSVCLTSNDDQLVCWGGTTTSLPQYTTGGPNITGAARGSSHTCVLTTAGIIRCTGTNGAGQLGDGTIGSVVVSVLVSGGASYRAVTAAANYSCALTQAGALHCWGDFPNASLRTAYGTRRRTPVHLLAGVTFASINATANTICGVTTDNRYICL